MTNLIKKNWLIILVIIFAIGYVNRKNTEQNTILPMTGGGIVADSVVSDKMLIRREVAPSESTNRLVIQDTSLSLQVDNVESKIKEIESKTTEMGGFLINSNLSKPNGVGSGTISVRIPEGKRDEAMELFKVMAVKVVSENVSGTAVTDQYTDLQAQLEVLQ
ncbi:hypothetical protein CO168_01300, partial [Candidatus Shapirobacteria bacterium CG_4_9_14_3_um_filter_36_12]